MSATLHHRTTPQPNMNKVLAWSLALHIAALVAMSLTFTTRVRLSTPMIQVTLVGVPQPNAAKKKEEPEKIRTQDSAAPKEPPKEVKNIPPSEATTKMVTEQKPVTPDKKENPVEAKERPPVLDKSPKEKKVVKNEKDAKVVKNPEDFLNSVDDFLKDEKASPKPAPVKADPTKTAGDGPKLQANLADSGINSAIADAVNKQWFVQQESVKGLSVVVQIQLSPGGDLLGLRVVQSSGNEAFDNSLIRAIRKAVPLPIPTDKIGAYTDFEMSFSQ